MHRSWRNVAATLGLCVLLAGIVVAYGCSSANRYRVLSVLFEGVPQPDQKVASQPFVRHPRRLPVVKPKPNVVVAKIDPHQTEKTLFLRDWKAVLKKLPKDAVGAVNWVKALEDKDISPKAGLDPKAPEQPVLPLNVELQPPAMPLFKVVFPHKQHTEWLACYNCHPKIFQMRKGADPITMAKILTGEYCGRCHSKVAFAIPTGCPRCHLALAGPK